MTRHGMVMPRSSTPSRGVAQMTTPNQRARMSQAPVATSTPESSSSTLPERLRSGYSGERGDAGSHRGKPPRCDRLLCGGERVHDPESRRCGVSAINEFEEKALELAGEAERLATRAHGRGGAQVCD